MRSCCPQLVSSSSSSAARAFLQLAPRRCFHNAPPQPLLDFLLPSLPSPALQHARLNKPLSSRTQNAPRRAFTTSPVRRHTSAVFNPRKDDDGNDMTVEITPRASNRLKEIMAKDENPDLALRIQVESGGCHGFQYLMSLTTLPPLDKLKSGDASAAGKLEEDDTVFAADDGSGAKVVMDGPSLELLKGSKVDFTMELIGSQFKIVDNPLATSSCGCGTSFDIKA
ncbi:hypothetical protein M430DRAFT_101936 [Amorphotheca resinae ATCC 22711]|uniref:Core domain-containing protein n=1 Tax=Amorphotheca resinae ATCC 22711 TaxID=857342 RepID=A0A2T3B2A4_AMORE|nr:hypothetical protein M430DRAFT_101936 [Amorphotheca resinae ATCC 22711]PSS18691.1 hypothetical protein M430DRAFT_101936 [Amorphotheca resinae ATCC 22711]